MAQVLSENITSSTVSQLKRANPINASTCICIGYCPVWRVLWVYDTHDESGQGRSPRPLFSRVLYTHNTRQTGQYLIYTIVTMYKANTVQFCACLCQNCVNTEALLYQNSTVWRVLWAYNSRGTSKVAMAISIRP